VAFPTPASQAAGWLDYISESWSLPSERLADGISYVAPKNRKQKQAAVPTPRFWKIHGSARKNELSKKNSRISNDM
jgi:hypothetical protein